MNQKNNKNYNIYILITTASGECEMYYTHVAGMVCISTATQPLRLKG